MIEQKPRRYQSFNFVMNQKEIAEFSKEKNKTESIAENLGRFSSVTLKSLEEFGLLHKNTKDDPKTAYLILDVSCLSENDEIIISSKLQILKAFKMNQEQKNHEGIDQKLQIERQKNIQLQREINDVRKYIGSLKQQLAKLKKGVNQLDDNKDRAKNKSQKVCDTFQEERNLFSVKEGEKSMIDTQGSTPKDEEMKKKEKSERIEKLKLKTIEKKREELIHKSKAVGEGSKRKSRMIIIRK